jgi:hypothetical protein
MFQKKGVEKINLHSVSDRVALTIYIVKVFYTTVVTMKGAHPWPFYRPMHKSGCYEKKYPPCTRSIIFKRRRKAHKNGVISSDLLSEKKQVHFAAPCEHNQQQQNKQIQQIHGTYMWRVRINIYCHGHQAHSLPVREIQIYIIFGNLTSPCVACVAVYI